LSHTVCGLLRLGIGRYFEVADAKRVAPLAAKVCEELEDIFGDSFDSKAGANVQRARRGTRAADAAEFDEAIEIGKRKFAEKYVDGSRTFSRT
jgi:hypothetical protein